MIFVFDKNDKCAKCGKNCDDELNLMASIVSMVDNSAAFKEECPKIFNTAEN